MISLYNSEITIESINSNFNEVNFQYEKFFTQTVIFFEKFKILSVEGSHSVIKIERTSLRSSGDFFLRDYEFLSNLTMIITGNILNFSNLSGDGLLELRSSDSSVSFIKCQFLFYILGAEHCIKIINVRSYIFFDGNVQNTWKFKQIFFYGYTTNQILIVKT